MSGRILKYLEGYLEGGSCTIGQVAIVGRYSLLHGDDVGRVDLEVSPDPHSALEVARLDEAGKFRPLKSAPNLRRGWRIDLATAGEVLLALDFLYPAAVGMAFHYDEGRLERTTLDETLGRQTGMYAVVKKITAEQAGVVCDRTCGGGHCLRQILWGFSAANSGRAVAPGEIPLLCPEACNLWVENGRKAVKEAQG